MEWATEKTRQTDDLEGHYKVGQHISEYPYFIHTFSFVWYKPQTSAAETSFQSENEFFFYGESFVVLTKDAEAFHLFTLSLSRMSAGFNRWINPLFRASALLCLCFWMTWDHLGSTLFTTPLPPLVKSMYLLFCPVSNTVACKEERLEFSIRHMHTSAKRLQNKVRITSQSTEEQL